MRFVTTCLLALFVLGFVGPVDAAVTVGPGSGFTWDGINGPPGGAVPNNLALATNGSTAFARDALVSPHTIAGLNNGAYGNSNSWIGATSQNIDVYNDSSLVLNTGFAGIKLPTVQTISSFALGRSNLPTEYLDRVAGNYYVQTTTVANPDTSTPDSDWNTIGSINISSGTYDDTYRHEFTLNSPVTATGMRVVVPGVGYDGTYGTAVDEIEIYGGNVAFSLTQVGGSFAPNNLAGQSASATAFAKDLLLGYPAHTIPHLNDETYGNSFSWIGDSAGTFAGVTLDPLAGPQTIASIAWGRDNTGAIVDRAAGPYTVQYTTVANPDEFTPDADWTTISTITYPTDAAGQLRHRYDFDPIAGVTGVRLSGLNAPTAIDEIELYSQHLPATPLTGIVIQDETVYAATLPNQGGAIPEPAPGDGFYHWTAPGEFTWMPLLEGVHVKVEASWGVSSNHSQDVDFFFDPDGSGPAPEIALVQNINQTLLDNGQPIAVGSYTWSDFQPIGYELELSRYSTFRVVGAALGTSPWAVSSGVWRFQVIPEPSTFLIWALGLLGLGWCGRRRRKG